MDLYGQMGHSALEHSLPQSDYRNMMIVDHYNVV